MYEEYDDRMDEADYNDHAEEDEEWREADHYEQYGVENNHASTPPPLLRFIFGLGLLEWLFGNDS